MGRKRVENRVLTEVRHDSAVTNHGFTKVVIQRHEDKTKGTTEKS